MLSVLCLTDTDELRNQIVNTAIGGLTCKRRIDKMEDMDFVECLEFVNRLIEMGHESVLEHINISYSVEGISRAVLQELARHRHISLSVESTRYCLAKQLTDPAPKAFGVFTDAASEGVAMAFSSLAREGFEPDEDTHTLFLQLSSLVANYMASLRSYALMLKDGLNSKQISELFKYFLPEFWPTSLVLTLNLRELRHIVKLRTSPAALFEMNLLAYALVKTLPDELHCLFEDVMDDDVEDDINRVLEDMGAEIEQHMINDDDDNDEEDEEDDD